ncbi:indole-3-glycerol phosphate synthase TrpC [Brevibacillus migulae]|uniref:indole-3-glycerol phosphate synthase TrpC n=1 Tax=Brevibacillus migulae TaxID=1644114 RepID=UPI00106ED561|nr:indole-3-glycerol phosphate synthase TrpC [Brevibacillus migulae]
MLHKIVETKREEVSELHQSTTVAALLEQAAAMDAPRGFQISLEQSARQVSVIAEVKKASPSKGLIREDFHPEKIAQAYQQAEVEAISVLTDKQYFQGNLDYLPQIRAAVSLPLLRKDFLIDEWQVVEARAYGADCILLIAAILDGPQIHHFSQTAHQLGMDVLIEVHDAEEAEKVFRHTSPRLLGINNRNLRTFQVDLATTQEVIKQLPKEVTVVSESGIAAPDDIACVAQAGARAVLVGEHFMRQGDIAAAVRDLVGERVTNR